MVSEADEAVAKAKPVRIGPESGSQRSLPVRQWKEVQTVLREEWIILIADLLGQRMKHFRAKTQRRKGICEISNGDFKLFEIILEH